MNMLNDAELLVQKSPDPALEFLAPMCQTDSSFVDQPYREPDLQALA